MIDLDANLKGDLPRVAAATLRALGGHEVMGQRIADDVESVRHGTLPEDKKHKLLLSYTRLIMNMLAKKDQYELDTSEFAGLSEQDLKHMLRQSAVDSLRMDSALRKEVMHILNQENPTEMRQMLGLEVLEAEPAYTEALEE
jgi:hypothetical protein